MYLHSDKTLTMLLTLVFTAFLFNAAAAQDQPNLSEAIHEAINSQGVEAAKEKFTSMAPSEREQYKIDMEGISELTNNYLEGGNMEALMAISEITGIFMQDMVAKSMEQYGADFNAMEEMAEQQEAKRDQERIQREQEREADRQQRIVERQGQPRDDLDRFKGLYGNPDEPESARQLWVNVSCDGYLVVGAMWGDAAPWWMRSDSDNVFTLEDSFNNIRMEFQGNQMAHNLEFIESPLERAGSLPEEWDSCMERYQ